MSSDHGYRYTLYSYFRSSCAGRVRIAAHVKGIPLEYKYLDLYKGKGDHDNEEYALVNPSKSVPTLIVQDSTTGKEIIRIGQSVAILEFFEELYTGDSTTNQLLPGLKSPIERAKVRQLVNIISNDIQPVTNLRVLVLIRQNNIKPEDWQIEFMTKGFRAYEELVKIYGGLYSVGDDLTLADCVLAPAVDGALRWGVPVQAQFPCTWKVWEHIKQQDAFIQGRWDNQQDTPVELTGTGQ